MSPGRPSALARPVALVGFMGVGKTSVGQTLAELLDLPFVDTDQEVKARSGQPIPELFAAGEPAFRALERECVLAALDREPGVIALGGGAFTQQGTAEIVLQRALVVHLAISWSELLPLLPALAADRPLIRDRELWEVQELFLARATSYRLAHLRLSVPDRRFGAAAATIAAVLRARPPHPG